MGGQRPTRRRKPRGPRPWESMTAEQLRKLRKRLGLTQKKLAARLNVSELTIKRWEGGATPISKRNAVAIRLLASS